MENEPIARLIVSFALPATVGMIAGAVYNIVDRVFVGRYVGSVGLAAITVSFPAMLVLMAFTLLLCIGGASRVSILFGARKLRDAEEALTATFVLLAVTGIFSVIASFSAVDFMLKLSGASGDVLEEARLYLKIILAGAPFGLFGFGANFLIRASGSPKYAMCTQIVGALGNVVLDAVFIIAFEAGVVGAAYGTILAQLISALFGASFFLRKGAPLKIRSEFIRLPSFETVKKICAVGSAPFCVELSFVCYMTLMNRLVIKYGGEAGLSAMGIFLSLDSLLFLPAIAVGEATQPIVGYNYGAKKPERVLKAIYCAACLAVGFYIVTFTAAELFAEPMMRLFTDDPELLAIGVPGMRVGYIGLPFMGITIVTNSALQGLGKGLASFALSVCRHIVCLFLPLLTLPKFFGILGVWMAFPCGDAGGSVIAIGFLFWIIRWLKSPEALDVK